MQLLMEILKHSTEQDYFYGTVFVPATIHCMSYSLYAKMKRLFNIPELTRQDHFNYSKRYFSTDTFTRDESCAKVSWYMYNFNLNSQKYMRIGSVVAVDESMGKCQSNCNYIVLMKNKPISKGFKFYALNDSFTGYCLVLVFHNQRKGTKAAREFTADIVVQCTQGLMNRDLNARLAAVVDNYYGSVDLADKLYNLNIDLVGTMRSNRIDEDVYNEISVKKYTYSYIEEVLHMTFKYKLINNYTCLYQCNDINIFQMICTIPELIQEGTMSHEHLSKVSKYQAINYKLEETSTHEIVKRMPAVARF